METTGQEPANADTNASIEPGEVDSKPVETEGADPAPAAAETGKPERDKLQERFDQLTREKYEGLSRAERAEYRAQLAEQRLAEREAAEKAKPETVAPSNDYPTLESAGWDEAKHATAVAAWSAKQAREAARAELTAEREATQRAESDRNWERRETEFIKSKPDYAEKVLRDPRSGGPVITDQMAQVIRDSEIGPEVAYYLGDNVAKSAEIARLPPHLQAREIGRIEARLEAAKAAPPPVSKAPPPTSRVDGGEAPTTVRVDSAESDTLSDAEWNRRRNAQEQARLRKARGG